VEFLQQNWYWAALAAASGSWLMVELIRGRGDKSQISPVEATLLINREDAQILDVREASEFASGHLPEARNIPVDKLAERIGELEKFKDKPIIVCCASGMRSGKACGELKKQGFDRLYNLAGGVDAWVGAGYPIKKGTRSK